MHDRGVHDMRLRVSGAVVAGQVVRGDVEVVDGHIAAVGLDPGTGSSIAVPGFVDVHVHGHGGVDFVEATAEDHLRISRQLAATGVTAYNPTLMSLPIDDMVEAMGRRGPGRPEGARILGFHLEGPFLSPDKPGAHRLDALVPPTPDRLERLLAAGSVDHITLAPELPGALDAIAHLAEAGVIVSLGHSTADHRLTHRAVDAGAAAVTHVFNTMLPLHHRSPGMVGAALTHPEVFVTAIFDRVHLADETILLVIAAAGDRVVAITDGTAAVDAPDDRLVLGDTEVTIVDGAPRLPDGTLAGSVLTMDQALRNLVDLGIGLPVATSATATAPARLAGLDGIGTLEVGSVADIAVLDDRLEVERTMVGGIDVFRP